MITAKEVWAASKALSKASGMSIEAMKQFNIAMKEFSKIARFPVNSDKINLSKPLKKFPDNPRRYKL